MPIDIDRYLTSLAHLSVATRAVLALDDGGGAGGGIASLDEPSSSDEDGPDVEPPCEEDEEGGTCCVPPEDETSESCPCESEGVSEYPIRYFNGEVQLTQNDLRLPASSQLGRVLSGRRQYSNRMSGSDRGFGFNWVANSLPSLIENSDGSITVVRGPGRNLFFDQTQPDVYVARFGARSELVHDAANGRLVLREPSGAKTIFHDFEQ